MKRSRVPLLVAAACVLSVVSPLRAQEDYDFALPQEFLDQLRTQNTLETKLTVVLNNHTATVHPAANDCEMHLAGTLAPTDKVNWDPDHIVVEPPNLCAHPAPGGAGWAEVFDSTVMKKPIEVSGFMRIFTEHASGNPTPANPNHTFEIHPAMQIGSLDFHALLPPPANLTAIKAKTAGNCLANRTLAVRYSEAEKRYEFKEKGGQCGNFAIVQVASITQKWIKEIGESQPGGPAPTGGGHSAIARVSADGQSRESLKIYTLANTKADEWLTSVDANKIDPQQTFIHGIFTYDWFALVKALYDRDTKTWSTDSNWKQVPFPLAFVTFGVTNTKPSGWLGPDDHE